jgi:hypothetical protein
MFEIFSLRLATGLVLALLVLPSAQVHPRFYRIHLLIVLGLAVAAVMAAWNHPGDSFWILVGLGLGAALVGTWCWSLEGAPGGQACLWTAFVALGGSLTALEDPASGAMQLTLGTLMDHATSAAVLGLATTAMLMGHWYLIAPTMSLQPLLRLLLALFVALGLRMLTTGVALWQWSVHAETAAGDQLAWLWLVLRWGAGFIGCLVLTWMAWQSARIRATQSATGILYVVVIFTFIGELTHLLLKAHTGYAL